MIVFFLHQLYLYNLVYSTYLNVLHLCYINECPVRKTEIESDLNKELELEEQKGEKDFSRDGNFATVPTIVHKPALAAGLKEFSLSFLLLQFESLLLMLQGASLSGSCPC